MVTVYRIRCHVTGKDYYGITISSLQKRWREHVKESRATRLSTVLYRAMRKHGTGNFSTVEVYQAVDHREAHIVERALIGSYGTLAPNGMNSSTGGESWAGRGMTPETRKKISISKTGKKMPVEAAAASAKARTGLKQSEETKAKRRATLAKPEIRAKCVAALERARTDPAAKEKQLASVIKLWEDPRFRQRKSDHMKALNARWKDDDYRRARSGHKRPEHAAYMKELWAKRRAGKAAVND